MTIDFPFEANWAQPVDISRAYKTEIIESRDLTEQRKSHRQQPRRTFEFEVQTTSKRAQDFAEYMEENIQREFYIPDFSRTVKLAAPTVSGTTILSVPDADSISWIYPGSRVFIGSTSAKKAPEASVYVPSDSYFKFKVEPSGSVADYSAAAFDDSSWGVGQGPFGDSTDPEVPRYNTRVDSGDLGQSIWIRFEVPAAPATEGFSVTLWHDDGVEVWVDGVAVTLPLPESANKTIFWVPATSNRQIVAVKVTDGVPSGGSTSTLAAVEYEGNLAKRETARVISVSGDSVVTTSLRAMHPGGTLIRPAVLGTFDQRTAGAMTSSGAGQFSLTFEEDPNAGYSEGYFSPEEAHWFDGREVVMLRPNWSGPASSQVLGYLETLDMSRGVLSHRSRQAENRKLIEASYSALRAESSDILVQMYHRLRGRRSEFFMPTFLRDLVPIGISPSGSFFLPVAGSSAFFRYSGSAMVNRIAIMFSNGVTEFHKVETITQSGPNSSLGLRDALGSDVGEGTIDRISWMPVWRMASDKLSMSWLTTESAESKMAMQQLSVDEDFTGVFPLVAFKDEGDQTYDISNIGLVSSLSVKGVCSVSWAQEATAGQNFTMTLHVETLASNGTTVLSIETTIVSGAGSVLLESEVDISQLAQYVRVTFTKVADNPGATVFGPSAETISFGGFP